MFRITSGNTSYEFGVITDITDVFSKNLITTPIPSMPPQRTFALETSASLKYTITFVRKNPIDFDNRNPYDSALWCNSKWLERVSTLTERWQARSNGYLMDITGDEAGLLSVPSVTEQIYITNISFSYKEGYPDTIFGSMDITITNQLKPQQQLPLKPKEDYLTNVTVQKITSGYLPENHQVYADESSYIMISDSTLNSWYLLQAGKQIVDDVADYEITVNDNSIVKSFEIHGGPGNPFEYFTMKISRKELVKFCPQLDQDILAGCNQLIVGAMGNTTLTVTKVSTTSTEYVVTAYCNFERIRGLTIDGNMPTTAYSLITTLISRYTGISTDLSKGQFITNVDLSLNTIEFVMKNGTNVWTAIQLCAMILNAKPFFAQGKFYLIDYTRLAYNRSSDDEVVPRYSYIFFGPLNLHPSSTEDDMYGRVVGEPILGNEGIDTVINDVKVFDGGKNEDGNPSFGYAESGQSRAIYAAKTYDSLSIDRFMTSEDKTAINKIAKAIATHIIKYRAEPQTSIRFSMKERTGGSGEKYGWRVAFPIIAAAESIESPTDEFKVTANSVFDKTESGAVAVKPQKLYLSSYTRKYPDFSTEYWFGVIENIDLSQSTSNIMQHVGMN